MNKATKHDQLKLPAFWESRCQHLFSVTQRMPKVVRMSLSQRIESLGLDILENVVEATYLPPQDTKYMLEKTRRVLNRLQVLVRFGYHQQFLSFNDYETVSENIVQASKMVNAWRGAIS
jgi:hypothetical protein